MLLAQIKNVLEFVGVQNLRISCDQPETQLNIELDLFGEHRTLTLTCQQIIDALYNSDSESANSPVGLRSHKVGSNEPPPNQP